MDVAEVEKVREKLRSGEYILKGKDDNTAKSKCWENFVEVVKRDDGVCIGFVKCKSCEKIYKHHSHHSGTSTLNRHRCGETVRNKNNDVSQSKMGVFLNQPTSKIPAAAKAEVTDSCVDMCCKDLRPFDIVSGEGFRRFGQALINIGARYGRVDVASVLAHRLVGQIMANYSGIVHLRIKAPKLAHILLRCCSFEKTIWPNENSRWRPFFKMATFDIQ